MKDNKNSNVIIITPNMSRSAVKVNVTKLNDLFSLQSGAQDLRIKMEVEYTTQPPTSNSGMPTPTSMVTFKNDSGLPGGLAASIAPADMLNVWNATKLNSKGGTVNTADGMWIASFSLFAVLSLIFTRTVSELSESQRIHCANYQWHGIGSERVLIERIIH